MISSEISLEKVREVQELSDLIIESIRQFMRTKEELMRTTLQVQIELLSKRLKRLKVTIGEIKNQLDEICVPKEVKTIEDISGLSLKPYFGASIDSENNIQEFSWKSQKKLVEEKEEVLETVPDNLFHQTINQIYHFYESISMYLYRREEEKSQLK